MSVGTIEMPSMSFGRLPVIPVSSATVGIKSQNAQAKSDTPGVIVPGQRAMVGERMPPSYKLRLWPVSLPVELKKW